MRALSCRPGTVLVIGVRLPALGRDHAAVGDRREGEGRGTPGSESLAGVVCGLLVVRSALAKQLTSARLPPSALSTSAQVTAGTGGEWNEEQKHDAWSEASGAR